MTSPIERHLGAYVAPEVVAHVMSRGRQPLRSGVRIPVTVLFADLRGFTRLATMLPPEHVVAMLDEYFDAATTAAHASGAAIDKLVGDALMLTFGVPVASGDEALRALRCAAAIHRAFAPLPARWRRRYGSLRVGLAIGIASGHAVLANVGSARRMDYTVIGTPVNLAARLTSVARAGETLVDAALHDAAAALTAGLAFGRPRRLLLKGIRGHVLAYPVRGTGSGRVPRRTAVSDPVCGMKLLPQDAVTRVHRGRRVYFCSASCRRRFDRYPERWSSSG